ncbi:hypothetical protein D3C72_1062650 [compost metagenome]
MKSIIAFLQLRYKLSAHTAEKEYRQGKQSDSNTHNGIFNFYGLLQQRLIDALQPIHHPVAEVALVAYVFR